MAELRALALEGKVDLTEVERRIREDRSLPICPLCSRFPVRRPSWGTCDPCHKHHLAEQHEEELAKLEGQRHLWVARKHLKETRKQLGIKAPGARD